MTGIGPVTGGRITGGLLETPGSGSGRDWFCAPSAEPGAITSGTGWVCSVFSSPPAPGGSVGEAA